MTIGFSSRLARSACTLCAAGVLALAPVATAAVAGTDSGTGTASGASSDPGASSAPGAGSGAAGGARTGAEQPDLLRQPGTQVRLRPGAPEVPEVSALSWTLADARTGEVLAAHDAHRRLPPASTLKTLFALTVLSLLPAGLQ